MKRKVAAVFASLGLLLGLALASASPAHAYIRSVESHRCTQHADAGFSTGYVQIYVDHLVDLTPSPDKARALYISVINHTNHTIQVDQIRHYNNGSSAVNWWTNSPFVLTVHGTADSAAGNYGELPWRSSPSSTGSTYNVIQRPVSSMGYFSNLNVATYSPVNQPWWTNITNQGPVFNVQVTSQGYTVGCNAFYG